MPNPLQVVVACDYANIECPECHTSNPADLHLATPVAEYREVFGVTANGELLVNEIPDTERFPGNSMPSHWFICSCGRRFALPAGIRITYSSNKTAAYSRRPLCNQELERLDADDVGRPLPTDTRPAPSPSLP